MAERPLLRALVLRDGWVNARIGVLRLYHDRLVFSPFGLLAAIPFLFGGEIEIELARIAEIQLIPAKRFRGMQGLDVWTVDGASNRLRVADAQRWLEMIVEIRGANQATITRS